MGALKAYASRDNKHVEAKNKLANNVENFYKGRKQINEGFKNRVFQLYYDERYEHQMKAEGEIERKEIEEKKKKKEREKRKARRTR